jgi:hypothetical protein
MDQLILTKSFVNMCDDFIENHKQMKSFIESVKGKVIMNIDKYIKEQEEKIKMIYNDIKYYERNVDSSFFYADLIEKRKAEKKKLEQDPLYLYNDRIAQINKFISYCDKVIDKPIESFYKYLLDKSYNPLVDFRECVIFSE